MFYNFDLEKETMGKGYITELDYSVLKPIIAEHNINIKGQDILPRLLDVFKNLDPNIKVNIEVKSPYALGYGQPGLINANTYQQNALLFHHLTPL